MAKRGIAGNLGIYVYGASAIALGVVGLAWRDFAAGWQRVPEHLPHRVALALAAAALEIVAGAAILWRRTARVGALALAVFNFLFVASWLAKAVAGPTIYDSWGNVFEEFSLVVAGMVIFASLAPAGSGWERATGAICRVYGVCAVSFSADHWIYLHGAASFVPRWIPPGQMFWAVATAIFFAMAAVAILTGMLARLGSRLLAVMISGFEVLVWAPKLAASPHEQILWAANGIATALAAGAWVVADGIGAGKERGAAT